MNFHFLCSNLNHINIVRFFGIFESSLQENSNTIFLVMEYVKFGSLNSFMYSHRDEMNALDLFYMYEEISEKFHYYLIQYGRCR
jgi:serine/threonine protein kinase